MQFDFGLSGLGHVIVLNIFQRKSKKKLIHKCINSFYLVVK